MEFLSSADWIIALNQSGNVIQQGTFENLSLTEGYIHSLSIRKTTAGRNIEEEEPESKSPIPSKILSVEQVIPPDLLSEASRQTGDFAVYKYYLSTIGIWNFWIFLFSVTAFAFFYVFPCKFPQLDSFFNAPGNDRQS